MKKRLGIFFFWGTSSHNPPICSPQTKGGYGLRTTARFKKVELAKLGWKILTERDNWWIKVITAKYLRHPSFLLTKKTSSASSTWKGILEARTLLT